MARYSQGMWSDFRLGLLTFVAFLILTAGLILAGGEKGLIFRKTSIIKAVLPDVGGLKNGCAVTMAGMSIGRVTHVDFTAFEHLTPIEVTMEIRSDLRSRIKIDSIPSVRTQGMMGDRYIDISTGEPNSTPLPEGQMLKGNAASDFDKALNETHKVLDQTEKLLAAVNAKEGTIGQLIYDAKLYEKLVGSVQDLNNLINDLKANPKKYLKFSVF